MLAVTAVSFDTDDPLSGLVVGDHPDPDPPAGWEVIAVRAASLNHHDVWTLRGVGISEDALPIVLGCDAAGVTRDGREVIVHAVVPDPGNDDELVGRAVSILSERYDGTLAERVAVPSRNLVDKPPELSFEEAACLPTAYLTAYRALFTRGGLRPGDRLLIQGAGGGVSTAAILLGRAAGLHLTVASRSADKRDEALALGAHEAVEAGERLPQRVDAVLESVGQATWQHSVRSVRAGGTVIVIGATTGMDPPAALNHLFYRQLSLVGSSMGTRAELEALVRTLLATGVRPLIDRRFDLSDARAAFARMVEGDLFGKLVLTAT